MRIAHIGAETEKIREMDEKGRTLRILIVDDDAEFLNVMREYLETLGYDISSTLSPTDALEVATKKEFDLIISDYKMPQISGLAIIEGIRGKGVKTPVLLVSGWVDTITEEMVIRKGGDGLLLKPFKLKDLDGAVRRILRSK